MTTIAAKRLPSGRVQIAWDAQATAGNQSSHAVIKVRKINGQFAVGGAGYLRFLNVIHRASVNQIHPADIIDPQFDAEGWLIDVLVPAWAKALQEAGQLSGDGEMPEGVAIVVLAGRIFEVGTDFSVLDMGPFAAIGTGGPFATAAMHLGKTARTSVLVASDLDLYTGGDVKELTL